MTQRKKQATAKPAKKLNVKDYPKRHLFAAAVLAVFLTVGLGLFSSKPAEATRTELQLTLPIKAKPVATEVAASAPEVITTATAKVSEFEQHDSYTWHDYPVKDGDSLALIFKRAGLDANAMYEVIENKSHKKTLKSIHPGQTLSFALDSNNALQALRYQKSKLTSSVFTRTEAGFQLSEEAREPDTRIAFRSATIDSSLFTAGRNAGMNAGLIMELANVFGWDIDFALDIRKGDSFNLIFEEKFLDGEKLGNGAILAAEFINQGDSFKAVRYTNSNGESHYYTPEGKSMRKAFLRAPVDFSRISSNFNPRRLHPILKTRRPHRGIDYAASRGTPVYSAGSGRVIISGYNKPSGNYVVIQHSNNIQTKYLHLNKRLVKKGQRVKQKQKIGTVGSTGYATGPHLHYEFVLNGVHRNPRTILQKLPKAKSVPVMELTRFERQTASHLTQLAQYKQSTLLAFAESKN